MSTIVYVLTALAAVVVVLTRLRLRGNGAAAGRVHVGNRIVTLHTVVGVLALVVWVAFLVSPDSSLPGRPSSGILGLALWWVVVVLGLMILVRWLPSRGRHAQPSEGHRWTGPALSFLGHVGMLVGVVLFTYAYMTSAV